MTEQKFKAKATELIKLMVDTIADKEYSKLVFSIPPKPSWASMCAVNAGVYAILINRSGSVKNYGQNKEISRLDELLYEP